MFAGTPPHHSHLQKLRRWLPRRVAVTGKSMLPTLKEGDRVLCRPAWHLEPGQVVVLEDPRRPGQLMIKRVFAVGPSGIDVRGDNPGASTDSRHFGPVAPSAVRGRVIWRYFPPARAGVPGPPPRLEGWP